MRKHGFVVISFFFAYALLYRFDPCAFVWSWYMICINSTFVSSLIMSLRCASCFNVCYQDTDVTRINIWNVAINFTINYNLFLQLMGDYFTPESCIFFFIFIHFSKQLFNSKSNQENIIQQPELRNRKLIAHFFAFLCLFLKISYS